MSRTFDAARLAVVLLGLTALPAAAGDFAGWVDNEVNAALASTRLQPPHPQPKQADLTSCPTMTADDVASAIDCEVIKALRAGSTALSAMNTP